MEHATVQKRRDPRYVLKAGLLMALIAGMEAIDLDPL